MKPLLERYYYHFCGGQIDGKALISCSKCGKDLRYKMESSLGHPEYKQNVIPHLKNCKQYAYRGLLVDFKWYLKWELRPKLYRFLKISEGR